MPNILDTIQVSGASYDLKDKNAPSVSSLTQSEYDNLPATAKTSNTFFVITDAQAGDLTNYYTKSETNTLLGGKADTATTYTKTEVDNAITSATSTKQDTLVSGTNIKTINNESILGSGNIDIQGGGGGGKAVTGGTNISVTTGDTADTINCTLPISADISGIYTTNNYPFEGNGFKSNNIIFGYNNKIYKNGSSTLSRFNLLCGDNNEIGNGDYTGDLCSNFVGGSYNKAYGRVSYSAVLGFKNSLRNSFETALGKYNNSVSASTTFGDSGNTLFSVGNGTADNARHNAFEIRQNGDIYLSSGGTDIKLQDHLGGGGGGGVNVVQTTGTSTTDVMSQDAVTTQLNNKADKSTAGGGLGTSSTNNYDILYLSNQNGQKIDGYYKQVSFSQINGKHIISQGSFNPNSFSLVEASAITTSVTSSSTDAQVPSAKAVNDKLGGLSLVKLTQAEYDALATKDNSTLYVIVN